MLDKIFSIGLDLFAFVTPISIAATNIAFFPLAALWLLAGRYTFRRWPAVWGSPEKAFLIFLAVSLVSALSGLDPLHSLREIKNEDSYLLIAIVLIALVRDEEKNKKLLKLFMWASLFMALFGLIQLMVGVNQNDKSNGVIYEIPQAIVHWPRPILDKLSLLNGRVMGLRGHPLFFAECLLFSWAFAGCFIQGAQGRDLLRKVTALVLIGAAIVVSQSRGPWIAAAILFILAFVITPHRKPALIAGVSVFFLIVFISVPSLRRRAVSIFDRSHYSNMERLHMWHAGIDLWKSHPLLGIGPGNVPKVSAGYQTSYENLMGRWGHLHSTYINFLAERGLLGLCAFLFYIGVLIRELWLALQKHAANIYGSALLSGALLGILGFLLCGLTETAYNTAVVNMTFYFVIGLALSWARHQNRLC